MDFHGTQLSLAEASDCEIADVRKKTAFVFQNYNLFANKTALENVTLGLTVGRGIAKDEAHEIAREALRRVGLEATELANGYATDTGDNGSALSGGQRQRVALARAVAADPEVLILVNPTSSVDTVTEHHIAQELHRVRAGRTTVVISDSPAFRAVADRVVEVES